MMKNREKKRPHSRWPWQSKSARERELVMRIPKSDLFDQHVLMPHAEVSDFVYAAVDRFLEKYPCSSMKLTIHTDSNVESVQAIFREAFIAHYEDESRRLSRYLRLRFFRMILLILVSLGAYTFYVAVRRGLREHPFVLVAISNLSAFCLWQIGNTHFEGSDIQQQRRRARCARDAKITFVVRPFKG